MSEVRLRVSLPADEQHSRSVFYILVEDGEVIHAPPVGAFMHYWPIDRVDKWVRKKGGNLE